MDHRLRWRPILIAAVFAAASLLAVVASACLPAAVLAQPVPAFSDVQGDEWFADAVYALADRGIIRGREDGSFGPNDAVSRAHMAMFLARVLELPESVWHPFTDVAVQDTFAGAVGALYQRGLIQGTTNLLFSPAEPVTRQQAASLVIRSLCFAAQSEPAPASQLPLESDQAPVWLAGFRDRALIAPGHIITVANAYRLGIIDSPVDGWFYPGLNLTRAQMAAMLYRAFLQPVQARNAYPLELPAVSGYPDQSVGSQGALVSFLEARLTALCYPCGPVDGVYDSRTRDAVMAFEKVEAIRRDGAVGPEVWQHVFTAQTPTPRRSQEGTRCEVDLTRQVLMMITDDRVWKIVHVSTGKLGTQTGHHQIRAKYEGWVKCVTLDGKMYYPSYIVSKTAIHGYESVPPYPASHGCVRVPVWTAVELYNQLPKGTPVDVYY